MQSEVVQAVYNFIYDHFEEYGYGPTMSKIKKNVEGIGSQSTASRAVELLHEAGMVTFGKANGKAGNTIRPSGVVVTMPDRLNYDEQYAITVAEKLAIEMGTVVEVSIGGRKYQFAGDHTHEGE